MINFFKKIFKIFKKDKSFKSDNSVKSDKISKNFSIEEFHCYDRTVFPKILIEKYPAKWIESRLKPLVKELEIIRKHLKAPVKINSAYRNEDYNKKVGGSRYSLHKEGLAVDISYNGKARDEVKKLIDELIQSKILKNGGLGFYKNFFHYDLRTLIGKKPARW